MPGANGAVYCCGSLISDPRCRTDLLNHSTDDFAMSVSMPTGFRISEALAGSKKRKALTQKLKDIFRRYRSQLVKRMIEQINPIPRGWVNYFAVGNSSRCFASLKRWVELKVRRHLMRAQQRKGFGWKRWSTASLYAEFGLFNEYRVRWATGMPKALPNRSVP